MEKTKPEIKKDDLLFPELSYQLIGCAFEVFNELGPGHLEKFYQKAYAVALTKKNIAFKQELYTPIFFSGTIIGRGFIDFFIEEKIVVELKKGNYFSKSNIDQVKEYLARKNIKLAILINFTHEKVVYRRIINFQETPNNSDLNIRTRS